MRRVLISSMTAIAVLGHAALGCCWHHAHESCSNDQGPLTERARQGHDHGSAHSHASHDHSPDLSGGDNSDSPDHGHVPCQDSNCTYVGTKSVQLTDSPASPTLPEATWLTTALPRTENCRGPVTHGTFLCPLPAFSPQHCALIQVWRL